VTASSDGAVVGVLTLPPPPLPSLARCLVCTPAPPGPEFSVSDIAVSSYLLYLPVFFPTVDLTPYPALLDYMTRGAARPACPDTYKEALAGGWVCGCVWVGEAGGWGGGGGRGEREGG
jgi:hypothetical protein